MTTDENEPNQSVPCLTRRCRECTGVTNPEYIGGIARCECVCHVGNRS